MKTVFAIAAALAALVFLSGCEMAALANPGEPGIAGRAVESGSAEMQTESSGSLAAVGNLNYAAKERYGWSITAVGTAPIQLSVQPDTTQPSTARVIIYSGLLRMTVPNTAAAIESIRAMAASMGGYLQDMDSKSITIRVPAASFESAVNTVAGKGEVIDKQIKAADVTEQMRDLGIRLENAEQTRQRLLKLLDQSAKVEDTVKIEDELEKVTEQVELLKGKIRFMQLDVEYSVLRVELNSPNPREKVIAAIPFPWVRQLGQGVVGGAAPDMARQNGIFDGGVGFDLPPGYVCFYKQDDVTQATSAEGVMIRVERHDNYKGGDIKFWGALARRSLVENQSITVTGEGEVKSSPRARLIHGTKDSPSGKMGYLLMISMDSGHVYTFEAWGTQTLMDRDMGDLAKSAESVAR